MHPRSFEYFAPKTLHEASVLLTKYKDNAKVLAGGHSLIPLMKLRLASPEYIVDINRIGALDYIKKTGSKLRIGALTRYYQLEDSKVVAKVCPLITEAVGLIGDAQVRSRGTIGGNLSHADPANDLPVAMLALDAEFVLRGLKKQRIVKASKFYTDVFTTVLRTGEILSEVRVNVSPIKSGGCFQKFERRAGDFAIVSVAAQLALDREGLCRYVGIGLGAVGPTPLKALGAEKLLLGRRITGELIEAAADKCSELSTPSEDLSGSVEYKKDMVKVFAKRAIRKAWDRAKA